MRRLVDAGENVVSVADPFDRILIAQAIAEGLELVTNDERISSYAVRTLW